MPTSTTALLAQVPLFAHLSPEELSALAALLHRRRFGKGEVIFHEGDVGTALYIIEEGEVRIVLRSPEGKEVVLVLLGRGDIFGELALLDGEPRSADAVAKEPSQLMVLRREDFLNFLDAKPKVAGVLLAALSRRLRRNAQILHDAAFLDVHARLARVLLDLGQTHGQPGPEGIVISPRLTQTELANLVGVTRESVNKWLRFYERRGIVRRRGGRLVIVEPQRLRQDIY